MERTSFFQLPLSLGARVSAQAANHTTADVGHMTEAGLQLANGKLAKQRLEVGLSDLPRFLPLSSISPLGLVNDLQATACFVVTFRIEFRP